jgi:hypothetical protein
MTRRRKWAAVPGFLAIGAIAAAVSAYSGATMLQSGRSGGIGDKDGAAQAAAGAEQGGRPAGVSGPGSIGLEGVINNAQAQARPMTRGDSGLRLAPETGPWGYSAASSDQGYSPEQPVYFPHPQHVQKLGMNCMYCHFAAGKSTDPGMPAVSTCMGCHTIIATQSPHIQKLAGYWNKKQPVPWQRIHKVPEYVHFPHMRHVNAGVTCQTCHGQVQQMRQVFQYASLNMGWCINCHLERKARYDCSTCHY